MPSVFDLFSPFENSLRSYRKNNAKKSLCPYGLHAAADCTCKKPTHECKRPHCSNDVPLDPLCKLSNSTPDGVPMAAWPAHKCHSAGCEPATSSLPNKPVPAAFTAVTDRLYAAGTRASEAKKRPTNSVFRTLSNGSTSSGSQENEDTNGDTTAEMNKINNSMNGDNGSPPLVGRKLGSRLIYQLIGDKAHSNHDSARRDGFSPSPHRRSNSAGLRRSNTLNYSFSEANGRRSKSSCAASRINRSFRSRKRNTDSDSEMSSSEAPSSPETSPNSTPSVTPSSTPRKHLSPKNSGFQLIPSPMTFPVNPPGATPRQGIARPSAVFAGGPCKSRNHGKHLKLNKSASDGVERLRKAHKKQAVIPIGVTNGESQKINNIPPDLHSKLSRVASDSRVDELLAQAHMALASLIPEQNSHQTEIQLQGVLDRTAKDSLHRLARAHGRKENGRSYKDLTQIMKEKIEELDDAMVSAYSTMHVLVVINTTKTRLFFRH